MELEFTVWDGNSRNKTDGTGIHGMEWEFTYQDRWNRNSRYGMGIHKTRQMEQEFMVWNGNSHIKTELQLVISFNICTISFISPYVVCNRLLLLLSSSELLAHFNIDVNGP